MPNATPPKCPICDTSLLGRDESINLTLFRCRRCGNFAVSGISLLGTVFLEEKLGNWDARSIRLRSRLSHVIRCKQSPGVRYVQIAPDQLESWRLEDPLPSPFEQIDRLILWIGEHQPSASESAQVPMDEVSAWIGLPVSRRSGNPAFGWLITQQEVIDLVETRGDDQKGVLALRLKMTGWARYEELTRRKVESQTAFMAMQFDEEIFRVVSECFKPAVAATGFELRTLADGQGAGLIDDQLRIALRRAKFVVADLTHNNNGAYWEAGFAEGLGRPVIYTCRKTEWEERKTHFDTNHLVTIVWDTANLGNAAQKLTDTIRATLPSETKLGE
jgi:hypothetical protein